MCSIEKRRNRVKNELRELIDYLASFTFLVFFGITFQMLIVLSVTGCEGKLLRYTRWSDE